MLDKSFRVRWPWPLIMAIGVVLLISAPPLVFYVVSLLRESKPLSELGAQGDFFGGHVAAIMSSLTLLIVLIGTYIQQESDRSFRLREHFLAGLNIIGQYESKEPGCEQALRFLDYYSRVALELEDEELLLLLNAVITKEIRSRLERLEQEDQPDIYVYARQAKFQLADLLRRHHMARKGLSPRDS